MVRFFLDNHDVRDYNRRDLRKAFGMVLQDTWLYKGTIMENIRYGRLDATDEEVIEAAKSSSCRQLYPNTSGAVYNMELMKMQVMCLRDRKQLLTIARAIFGRQQGNDS